MKHFSQSTLNSSQIYKLNIKRQEEKKEEKYSIFEASKESGEFLCNYNTDISIPEIWGTLNDLKRESVEHKKISKYYEWK